MAADDAGENFLLEESARRASLDEAFSELSAKEKISRAVSKHLKGKNEQWDAIRGKGPLTLLELPVDILQLILKEITHTNDLTALALTNSALYALAVPHIYARFDIVWPEGQTEPAESKSVDALTYGLSTLCLGSAFARTMQKLVNPNTQELPRFAHNNYAQFTRKFSLGNGPTDWVAEYMIIKESGKMLGTLVALAVAKMVNLETFIWDMPTGVLSDIFMALSSLGDNPDKDCKLDKVWIRWHDNSEGMASTTTPHGSHALQATSGVPAGSTLTPVGILLPANASHPTPRTAISYAQHTVEYPTFSVLPPVKSLTVLDIDELSYLDEMAMLIERSKARLQELRVGIASHAAHKDFVYAWDGPGLKQVDHKARWPGESTIGERRLGGVLGVLVGRIYDIKRKSSRPKEKASGDSEASANTQAPEPAGEDASLPVPSGDFYDGHESSARATAKQPSVKAKLHKASPVRKRRLDGKLRLHTLALERISMSMHVCRHAIDWSVLTSLTILDCLQHDHLWKMLKRVFQPTPMACGFGIAATKPPPPPPSNAPMQYHLALKHLHTDVTSPALVSFLKETLAPNSLEVLFLQDRRRISGPPVVTIDQIFKGPIKRHRSSLRKLLLDSGIRPAPNSENPRWKYWVVKTEMLLYITSGRMSALSELSVALEHKDWHTFLQRLPNLSQLRSIHIPHLTASSSFNDQGGPPKVNYDPKELAMQITDIITLRPEIELCYVGLFDKCFEVLESRDSHPHADDPSPAVPHHPGHNTGSDADEEDTSEEEDGPGDEEGTESGAEGDEDDDGNNATGVTDPDETQSETEAGLGTDLDDDDDDDDDFVEPNAGGVRLRLREILFYDDKIAIFKARHAQL